MNTIKYLLLFFYFILISCNEKSNPIASNVDFSYLYVNWVHAYEEENINDSIKIFRPNDYKTFPPSRYREMLSFKQDSSCVYLVLAPNDAHYFQNGRWSLINKEKNIIKILDSSNTVYKKFQIIELKQNILKIILVD
ncbi:MAG: hypothetical protein Q7S39_01430 [Ignavibacteria bacterium]|nr:hypothetical protein [Ignavibacteria bacterium]